MRFIATYLNRATSEKYCKTLYADDVSEASKQAEKWARKGYMMLKVAQA